MPRRHLPEEFRFDARYGRLIRKAGIGTIPFALFAYQAELALQPQEVWFISYILAHRWTADLPFPSLAQMARHSGLTKRALRNYKDSLVAKGFLLVVERQRPDGGTTSHGYDFSPLFDLLDDFITRDFDRWARRNPQLLEEADALEDDEDTSLHPREQASPLPGVQADMGAGKRRLTGRRKAHTAGPGYTRSPQEEELVKKKPEEEIRNTSRVKTSSYSKDPIFQDDSDLQRKGTLEEGSPADSLADDDKAEVIQSLVEYISGVLHDTPKSRRGTVSRVQGLWEASGLAEETFLVLMREALQRTQQASASIRRPAGDGSAGLKNKVPYYLQVLENLLQEHEQTAAARLKSQPGSPARLPVGAGDGQSRSWGAGTPAGTSEALWAAALAQLREQMTAGNFGIWLADTRGIRWQGDNLVVAVNDAFTRDWLELRLAPLIRRTVRRLVGSEVDVAFVVAPVENSQRR